MNIVRPVGEARARKTRQADPDVRVRAWAPKKIVVRKQDRIVGAVVPGHEICRGVFDRRMQQVVFNRCIARIRRRAKIIQEDSPPRKIAHHNRIVIPNDIGPVPAAFRLHRLAVMPNDVVFNQGRTAPVV